MINPVPKAVLYTDIKTEKYTDGYFIELSEWKKLELNSIARQEEIDLLRVELSKFEDKEE